MGGLAHRPGPLRPPGWVTGVTTRRGSADVGIDVMRTGSTGEVVGPMDLVIVVAAASPIMLPDLVSN